MYKGRKREKKEERGRAGERGRKDKGKRGGGHTWTHAQFGLHSLYK
jgi:hypothetical protein